jgi:lipid-binding SYLF domain-containing protein
MQTRSLLASALITVFAFIVTSSANAEPRQEARLLEATQVLKDLRQTPDQNVPEWLLQRAYAVAVVPNVIKVSLMFGGRRGSGVLVVRKEDGTWSSPIFINLTGGSFGPQVGVQSTDVLLVFTSRAGIEGIVGGKVTLGADASVAAGPVGRQTSAATDVGLNAQVYSYSRAKGLFIGMALDGSGLTIDHGSNEAYYRKPGILASEIMAGSVPAPDQNARQFISAIGGATSSATAKTAPTTQPSTQPTPAPQNPKPGSLATYPMEDAHPGSEPPP